MADVRKSLSDLQTDFADNGAKAITAQYGRNAIISAHPEKVVQAGALASEPASGRLAGDLYFPSDAPFNERWNGSIWVPRGPTFEFTKPDDSAFAWINQGGATVDTSKGGICLEAAGNGSAQNFRIRKMTAPSTPYTITVAFLLHLVPSANGYGYAGLCFRQSSDGKLATINFQPINDIYGQVALNWDKWSSASAYSANYGVNYCAPAVLHWLRIEDDGTNRKLHHSINGLHWAQIHTVGRTDYLTADEIGFFVNPYSCAMKLHLLSWKQA